jgi:hypothetical protein
MKTKEQIEAAIKALEEIKPKVRHFTAFGDDNWKSIEAQIVVLERKYSEDQIYNRYDYMNVLNDALAAHQWMNDLPIDDLDEEVETLADMWKDLVVK